MKKLIGYFFQGLLFTVPIAATIYLIFKIIFLIDGLLPEILQVEIPRGIGLILIVLLITLIGYLSTFYFANPIMSFLERLIEKVPLLKVIYTSIKDLVKAFVGEKRRFNHPVLVLVNKEANVQRVGFVTQNDLTELGIAQDKIAVYLPFSYSFAGTLIIVPRENVSPIDASGTEMMKFVISGGVTEI